MNKTLPSKKLSFSYGYRKLSFEQEELQEYLNIWEEITPKELFASMREAKEERDGAGRYHATIIQPKEQRLLRKTGVFIPHCEFHDVQVEGIGSVKEKKDGGNVFEAHYLVLSSPSIADYRSKLELPKAFLHITLGFNYEDIHNQDKSLDTIYYKF